MRAHDGMNGTDFGITLVVIAGTILAIVLVSPPDGGWLPQTLMVALPLALLLNSIGIALAALHWPRSIPSRVVCWLVLAATVTLQAWLPTWLRSTVAWVGAWLGASLLFSFSARAASATEAAPSRSHAP